MTAGALVLRYTCFALIAIVANLSTQRVVLWFVDNGAAFAFALAAGTIVGLLLKYILDKRWIFGDLSYGMKAHGKRFSLYTAMGAVTTAIFWGFETVFWLIWQTDLMREFGAVLGLTIGYFVKYNLDRRFVFNSNELAQMT